MAFAVENGELLPMGLSLVGGSGKVLPIQEEELRTLAAEMNMLLRRKRVSSAIQAASAELVEYSYEDVRCDTRDAAWSSSPLSATSPTQIEVSLREEFASLLARIDADQELDEAEESEALVVNLMLELCDGVAAENPSDGLASQLASVDITDLAAPAPGPLAFLFTAAHAAALQSDRHRRL